LSSWLGKCQFSGFLAITKLVGVDSEPSKKSGPGLRRRAWALHQQLRSLQVRERIRKA
jgi:hypothetical protein